MPIILPESREEILQNLQTDFVANIPESDPFIRESWLLALLIAIAYREFDIYTQVGELILQLFPNTAEGVFARQWGNLKGVDVNPATSASGLIAVTGITSTVIPEGTTWSSTDSKQYDAINQDYTIQNTSISITSLTSSGGIAEATTSSAHHFGSEMTVTMSGAVETAYNGSYPVTVTDDNVFKYEITGSPSSPATGTILATASFASVLIQADDTGLETNVGTGAQLTLVNPIAGVDSASYVQFTEIGGGANEETNDEYRARYLERYQEQVAHFNVADIVNTAKEVAGVTRVFVFRITPEVGDVTVFFMRDDDDNPIPNGQEVTDVRERLTTITPAHTPISDTAGLIVKAPTPQSIDFTFTNLSPNTSTMKTAIEASLAQFFKEDTDVGEDILQIAYSAAILQTVDPATGLFVQNFTLSNPTGDIGVVFGNIGILGTITFSV